jgi:UDP-glucose:tetrahydrobiopterin glucosyltransferase
MTLRLLFLSTPVGPLGSGQGGGVEQMVPNLATVLQQWGYRVTIVAPEGSVVDGVAVVQVAGALQPAAHHQPRDAGVTLPGQSVLANMWHYAWHARDQYDLIVNFTYDWLSFYLTPCFNQPIAHLVSMGSLTDAMDAAIGEVVERYPSTTAMHTRAQANTFTFGKDCRILGCGLDISRYSFCDTPGPWLGWMGRISPEKGLEDAVSAAIQSQYTLRVLGKIEDYPYWQMIHDRYPNPPMDYLGFQPTNQLQAMIGPCQALLMSHRWVEAFGIVAIEALACGVPVISYRRGGPTEIIIDGKTGWLVEPDSVDGLVDAIARIPLLDRRACRQQAEDQYSLAAMGKRFEQWFLDILTQRA